MLETYEHWRGEGVTADLVRILIIEMQQKIAAL